MADGRDAGPAAKDEDEDEDDDDDLAALLVHLAPAKLEATRERLANSVETRAFLDAGVMLLHLDLFDHRGPDLRTGEAQSELFSSLSRERVVAMARDRALRGAYPTEAQYRERWPHRNRFNEDLIAYLFRPAAFRARVAGIARSIGELDERTTFEDLVREVAALEVRSCINDPVFRLQQLLQVAMPNHERVREHVRATYDELLPWWAEAYRSLGDSYGFSMRPGRTYLDLALLFRAVIDGVLLQNLSNDLELTLSDGSQILHAAIMAMLPSLADLGGPDWPSRLPLHARDAPP